MLWSFLYGGRESNLRTRILRSKKGSDHKTHAQGEMFGTFRVGAALETFFQRRCDDYLLRAWVAGWKQPGAVCKETFWWKLVFSHEISGSRNV